MLAIVSSRVYKAGMTTRAVYRATCLVMAALAGESQNSGEIVARVREMSGGRVQLRAGTLFTVLDKLCADDLVRVDRDELVGGRLRRYYRLSSAGSRPVESARLTAHPELRISDAEREAATAALGDHFARGRLTADELNARLGQALAAVTRRDIGRATQDLPREHAWPEGGGGDGDPDHPARQDAEAP
jgi:DNA-binding PadR family transcriptional regulator